MKTVAILSTLDTGQIVRTALRRLPEAWPCSSAQLIVRRRGQRDAERHLWVCSEEAIQTCRLEADGLRALRRVFRGVTDALIVALDEDGVAATATYYAPGTEEHWPTSWLPTCP